MAVGPVLKSAVLAGSAAATALLLAGLRMRRKRGERDLALPSGEVRGIGLPQPSPGLVQEFKAVPSPKSAPLTTERVLPPPGSPPAAPDREEQRWEQLRGPLGEETAAVQPHYLYCCVTPLLQVR